MMRTTEKTKDGDLNSVTIGEAARYLGIGRRVVYQLIDFGRLQASRRRQEIRVDRHNMEEFRRSGGIT
jgi:excisionase family DNA binding protein